jgi:iron(III) transport system ATP-binding protein
VSDHTHTQGNGSTNDHSRAREDAHTSGRPHAPGSGPSSELSVSGLWKGYGGTPVLRGLDLEVQAGSLTAVLGLSGCGKTTLLRVIAGFEQAERGSVSLGPRTLDDGHTYVAPEKRDIGYVPQEGALFPHLSVEANVGFGLTRRERRGATVGELLEMVGIAPLARRLPHELSGGEQQRVALARALACRPRVLLLDEPFSSLDASLRTRVREEVHALLREQGVTTVLVTHDQEEALSLADTVAVLRDGTIVQQGTPAELYERPADARLARFLGAANMIDAAFVGETARTPLGELQLRLAPASRPAAGGIVLVRPEQLEVVRAREATAGADDEVTAGADDAGARSIGGAALHAGCGGTVEQCRYYGHDALLHIRPDESSGLSDTLLARVHGEQALPVGTRVTIAARGSVTPLA